MAQHVIGLVHAEAGAYGISFPDFPGVVSGGDSIEEAVNRGAATLAFHVEGMLEDGDELPAIRSIDELRNDPAFQEDSEGAIVVAVPVELPGKAVRVNISIDETLLSAVDRAASSKSETRSGFIAEALKRRLKQYA